MYDGFKWDNYPGYNWAAQNCDGEVCLYRNRPDLGGTIWWENENDTCVPVSLGVFPVQGNWRESLQHRDGAMSGQAKEDASLIEKAIRLLEQKGYKVIPPMAKEETMFPASRWNKLEME